jgi:hypothetical protein
MKRLLASFVAGLILFAAWWLCVWLWRFARWLRRSFIIWLRLLNLVLPD